MADQKYSRSAKLEGHSEKRAIVFSYSNLAKDSRVLRQIKWLTESGISVDAVGLGDKPSGVDSFFRISPPKLLHRLFLYVFTASSTRGQSLLKSIANASFLRSLRVGKYSIVILNDLDFLGFDELFDAAEEGESRIVLDLHEYFPDLGGTFLFKALHGRYYRYLQRRIPHRSINGFITVSPEIAALYSEQLNKSFLSIENIPEGMDEISNDWGEDNGFTDGKTGKFQLVYHGNPGKGRGLYHLLLAMRLVKGDVVLNLMLSGSKAGARSLQVVSNLLGLKGKVKFWPPVEPHQVTTYISRFDLSVIFFPPPHSTSINLSLPNKFFESLSAGLGVLVGPNPAMRSIVQRFGCGEVLLDWSLNNLASQITEISQTKHRDHWERESAAALLHFTLDSPKNRFLRIALAS
jgi:glycosyltransferase involved in cell wall biosynthesis